MQWRAIRRVAMVSGVTMTVVLGVACADLKEAAVEETGDAAPSESPDTAGEAKIEKAADEGGAADATTKRACPPAADFPQSLAYVLEAESVFDTVTGLEWVRAHSSTTGVATFAEAKSACTKLRTGKHSDWRPPTRSELLSIVDYQEDVAKISRLIFPEAFSGPGWTSTSAGSDSNEKWLVDFSLGTLGPFSDLLDDDGEPNVLPTIRCVRVVNPPCPAGARRFVKSGNIVRDEVTGLEWEAGTGGTPRSPAAALSYCSTLAGADTKRPWRVPAVKELESLIVSDAAGGFVDPLFASKWEQWWAATLTSSFSLDVRYFLDLPSGRIAMEQFDLDAPLAVRCVR